MTTKPGWDLYEKYVYENEVAGLMSERGIQVSQDRLNQHRQAIKERYDSAFDDLYSYGRNCGMPRTFNARSDTQLKTLFYDILNAPRLKYSEKTGEPSLDEKSMAHIKSITPDPKIKHAIELLERIREYGKLLSTYINKFEERLDPADYVFHPDFRVWAAISGRWGSFMHTIPKTILRDMFVARPGQMFLECDFAQLELREVALLAGEPNLLAAYERQEDVHTQNAIALFGECNPGLRQFAKIFAYNANYSSRDREAAVKGMWQTLVVNFPDLSLRDVDDRLRAWFTNRPAIDEWRNEIFARASERDFVEEPTSGRRRYFYGKVKDTEVFNFQPQSMGSHLMHLALRDFMSRRVTRNGVDAPLVDWKHTSIAVQWHDALHIETDDPDLVSDIIVDCMQQTLHYRGNEMLFTADIKRGSNLYYKD